MKKRLAILSVMTILLMSGCSVNESPAPTSGTSETFSEITSVQQTEEPEKPDEFREPLFRESSLYFQRVTDTNAKENFLSAASSRKNCSGEELGLQLISSFGDSGRYYYKLGSVKANAFVDFRAEDDISVIIDPAYMYNIPLPSLDYAPAENYEFDINGNKVVCDSLSVQAKCKIEHPTSDDGETPVSYLTDGYCYAAVAMDIFITASEDGIKATGELTGMENLTDAETALNVCFLGDDAFDSKSADAAETYKALLSIKDTLLGDDIVGVNLIDLDFDGKPEVLVSRIADNDDSEWRQFTDVDIYAAENSKLGYIGTLYNNDSGLVSRHGNVIGLKTLKNGEKAWYTMSRINLTDEQNPNPADYLFTLKDGKLEFTEIFSSTGDFSVSTGDGEDAHYYVNGEELQCGVYYDYFPYYDPNYDGSSEAKPDWPYYTYGDYTASFGKWEIYGWLRRDYCKDITQTFSLYSDEFCTGTGSWSSQKKLPVTERMVDYKLANLTDAYYFGTYDPTIQNYYYEFLGGYAKPVIYLYPTETTDVSVKVELDGELTCTYPDYRGGWNVTASPDGTLTDKATGKEYYCLYWEGESSAEWDMSRGEVIRGDDTAAFLEEKLTEIGLSPRERNEFIIYWLPKMQQNEFNYITFHTEDYAAAVPLDVTPQPGSSLRVFMVYASVPEYFETHPQHFNGFQRNGFTLVEWGGGEASISQ